MSVLLLAEVSDGALSMDATAKAVTAAKIMGDVTVLCAGASAAAAGAEAATIDGAIPQVATITSGAYPVSRPLYFYVKKDHIGVVPGINEYLLEFTSERAWGTEGYLADKGMIPLHEKLRGDIGTRVR